MHAPAADPADAPAQDLSLHDAALAYEISARTLAQHVRCGQLPAYKTHGVTGRQWRITREALDAAGYRPRPMPATAAEEDPLVTRLRRELVTSRRAVAAERRRADDLDRHLGHALLECGRLRAQLTAATSPEAGPTELDLVSVEARSLVEAARRTTKRQQPSAHA